MNTKKFRLLPGIKSPADLKKIQVDELPAVCEEIRRFMVQNVAKTGGHLGSSLGVIELTVALHYLFESPKDKIIWDVGHQSYAHKILTGRKDKFHTLRQYKGISGFPKITESEHDVYGTGHASTSISAALGFAKARDIEKNDFEVIAVIGDGAMTGGNALEAINQAGYLNTKMIIILNDNRMSITGNVGAISNYTHRIERTDVYLHVKKIMEGLIRDGGGLRDKLLELKSYMKDVGSPGLLFEKLGLNYIGPVDGCRIPDMLEAFNKAKQFNGPSLVHVFTVKGKGYQYAENDQLKFHGVNPFNLDDGSDVRCASSPCYSDIFSEALIKLAGRDDSIVAISAAMPHGTGLAKFQEIFPQRFFDVGIAEQHAVVFAAGLARQGMKPVCAIYSTFLQRAYDAIVHDVCLQNLPVIFAVDRAGFVGNDGPTHHGCFDLSYLRHIPNLIILAPRDAEELRAMLGYAVKLNKPVAIRYPREVCDGKRKSVSKIIETGKCELITKGKNITIVSIGTIFSAAFRACSLLAKKGIKAELINARFVKPLDPLIVKSIEKTGKAIIVEENAVKGGFGSAVLEACGERNIKADIRLIGIPDVFIEQGPAEQLRNDYGINAENIVKTAEELFSSAGRQLILVDGKDNILGYESKELCHKGKGKLHRAFSIFIFNEKKQLLIQQRSKQKLLWPGYWSNSACSHPDKDESYRQSAVRRLREELGIKTSLRELFKFKYRAGFKNIGSEYEMCVVFIGKIKNGIRIKMNKEEISACKFIDIDKLNKDIKSGPEKYTPWFKIEWSRINKAYLDDIGKL